MQNQLSKEEAAKLCWDRLVAAQQASLDILNKDVRSSYAEDVGMERFEAQQAFDTAYGELSETEKNAISLYQETKPLPKLLRATA